MMAALPWRTASSLCASRASRAGSSPAAIGVIKDFRRALETLSPGNLRLSVQPTDAGTGSRLSAGAVPLPHAKLDGSATTSGTRARWRRSSVRTRSRRSPCSACTPHPICFAAIPTSGADDVTYAAAWELGRLLALQNESASAALYHWKRRRYQEVRAREAGVAAAVAHVPAAPSLPEFAFPRDWFEQLARLRGVPFNYLVPDEGLLPPASIRFFCVDQVPG